MVMFAVAVVGPVTWNVFTATLLESQPVSVVVPGFHSVLTPAKLIVSVWPGMPEVGDSYQTNGVGGGGGAVTRKFPIKPCVPVATTTER